MAFVNVYALIMTYMRIPTKNIHTLSTMHVFMNIFVYYKSAYLFSRFVSKSSHLNFDVMTSGQ